MSDKIVVAYSGAGFDNATAAAKLLLAQGAGQLISWGCAAALSAHLKPGDLVLADKVLGADGIAYTVDPAWHAAARKVLAGSVPVDAGTLLESRTLISGSAAKQHLQRQTSAIALDMESGALAQVAHEQQVPFLVIRAIADPVDMSLPNAVAAALDSDGEVQLSRLASYLLTHPAELPALIRLGRHFGAARQTLKQVAQRLDAISGAAEDIKFA